MNGFLYVVSAFGLGALHALEPGHGKTLVAAYLVGSKGRPRDAVLLGLVVTLTHTLGVFALAALTMVAATYLVPAQVEHALELASGILVLAVGVWLLWQRVLSAPWQRLVHQLGHKLNMAHAHSTASTSHGHDHHGHHHDHDHHGHSHAPALDARGRLDLRALIALGISGGIVPCPGALAVLLTALAAGGIANVLSSMGLVVVFSIGLASVLIALGLAAVWSVTWFERRGNISEKFAPIAAQASAWMIFGLGIYLTTNSLLV